MPELDFFSDIERIENENRSAGGFITKVKYGTAYKVFAPSGSGFPFEATIFPFNASDKVQQASAKQLAEKFVKDNDIKSKKGDVAKPWPAVVIVASKDNVLGREVQWEKDRTWTFLMMSKAWQECIKISLKNAQMAHSLEYWAHVSFVSDPENPTRMGKDRETGEEKEIANLIPYIKAVYPTKSEADKAASELFDGHAESSHSESAPKTSVKVPPGWNEGSWTTAIVDIKKELAKGRGFAEVASDYGVPPIFVKDLA